MSKRLVVEDEATEELREAARHYERERVGLGVELVDEIDGVFASLVNGTAASVTVPSVPNELGIRRVLLERFPFAVIHIDEPDAVHVLAVAHFKREPGYWLGRARGLGGAAPRKRR